MDVNSVVEEKENVAYRYETRWTTMAAKRLFLTDTDKSFKDRLYRLWKEWKDEYEMEYTVDQINAALMVYAPSNFYAQVTELFTSHLMTSPSSVVMDQVLDELEWKTTSVFATCWGHALYQFVLSHVQEIMEGDYTTLHWNDLTQWFHETKCITDILIVAQVYWKVRSNEMFDLVTQYPDTLPALQELQHLLQQYNNTTTTTSTTHNHNNNVRNELATCLRTSIQKRALHSGVPTQDILNIYYHTIQVIPYIIQNPTTDQYQSILSPIQVYLKRKRSDDTIRCIITNLIQPSGIFHQELLRSHSVDSIAFHDDNDDTSKKEDVDVLALLVKMYGNDKNIFVQEYRLVLADALLASCPHDDNDTTQEDEHFTTCELLKIRFGESSMRNCEIMLKDMDDSRRINTNLLLDKKQKQLNATILSHIFWPSLSSAVDNDVKFSNKLQSMLDQYSAQYAKLKNPRRLLWYPQLGSITLDLDVYDEDLGDIITKEITCSPIQANILSYFEEKEIWNLDELSTKMNMSQDMIVKNIKFWIRNGIVSQLSIQPPYTYAISHLEELQKRQESLNNEEEEEEEEMGMNHNVSKQHQQQQQQQNEEMYKSYICGMLTNLGSLPLDRIHNMLKMFVTSSSSTTYTYTPLQLRQFLQTRCHDKIECTPNGQYQLIQTT